MKNKKWIWNQTIFPNLYGLSDIFSLSLLSKILLPSLFTLENCECVRCRSLETRRKVAEHRESLFGVCNKFPLLSFLRSSFGEELSLVTLSQ